ncbi:MULTISPECIES: hypothetical protein [Deinococcus]|uniref:Uncharacterized protein n=1 Tax=Deinococcus rufus TaxID=2136097 RepID=A0ABV7Z5P5_9DEIO|nr:hypothetical protein [Deinococcus sp. AB2017081]WQE95794.1 hypothetical protein U2P90_02610 [Deinococcus sp. AB2017081]
MKDSDKAMLDQAVKAAAACIIDYIDNDIDSLVRTPEMSRFPRSVALRSCILTPIAFADFEANRTPEHPSITGDPIYQAAFEYANSFRQRWGSNPFGRIAGEAQAMQQHLEKMANL